MDQRASRESTPDVRSRDWDDPDRMLGVDEARARILAAFSPLEPVETSLLASLDLTLAENVTANDNIPPFSNSAMDGYAVRHQDVLTATPESPVTLRVVGQSAAGSAKALSVASGEAVRIMTGAVLPAGADAVVRFEETDEFMGLDGQLPAPPPPHPSVRVFRSAREWENVRHAGEDIARGTVVLRPGTTIAPAVVGVLASLNRASVLVHRRPRVAILSTGDEVVDLGGDLRPGQIRNSNSYTLAALVRRAGGDPILLGVVRDELQEIRTRLRSVEGADLILTSGGVSLGDYDVVKQVLQLEGRIELWQVRIKPGKPMAFGTIGHTPLIGLPGNPVAAYVAFLQFGRPAILKMLGRQNLTASRVRARLLEAHENRGRRRHFVRGLLEKRADEYVVKAVEGQGSGVLTSVLRSNCFIVLPESWDHAPAGSIVEVEPLDHDWPV